MKNRILSSLFLPLFLTSLTLLTQTSALAQVPSTGLVGYWPFNGNANDESGNGNNGTVNGATLTTDRFGNANSAYSFVGGATISVPHNASLGFAPTGDFSASFWFYTTSITFPQHFMGKRPNNTNIFNWQFLSGTNLNTPEYSFASGLAVNSYNGAIAYQNLDVGQWVQLIGVYSNGNWKLFKNGVQIDETQGVFASSDVSCNLLFGSSGNAQPFTGKLDDISIYNRALSPAEITQLYTDQTSLVEVPCTPFLGEDQTVCAGTSVTLSAIDTLNVYNGPSFLRFIGGAGEDQIRSLVKDENGDLYVYGYTGSADFPVTIDAYQNTLRGQSDLFLTKLDGQGNIIWSTFIGGDGSENIGYNEQSLALDSQGNIIIGGLSSSSNFPTTTGAFQTNYNLNTDCVLAKFSSSGALIWSSYYGGSQGESINQIVVDSNDNIYITGYSYSFNFPTSSGAFQTTGSNNPSNNCDMFLVKFDSNGQRLWGTLYGNNASGCNGGPYEDATFITLTNNEIVFGGYLTTNNLNVTPGAFQSSLQGGCSDGFYSKFSSSGARLYSSYFGGNGSEIIYSAATDLNSNNYFAGLTASSNFPASNQNGFGLHDAVISKVSQNGIPIWSKKFGGSLEDKFNEIQLFDENLYALGYTSGNPETIPYGAKDAMVVVTDENGVLQNQFSAGGSSDDYGQGIIPVQGGMFIAGYTSSSTGWSNEFNVINGFSFGGTDGFISFISNGELGGSSYLWNTGDTTANISVTPTQTTTYTCIVTDANGNVCTDSVTVFVPQIEATDLTICAGETTTLSVSGINSTASPSACPTLPTNLQTGLVGYWPFCGNANDASGNGNNGTVNGATLTTDRFGNSNSAFILSGTSNSILVNDSPSLDFPQGVFSLCAEVKLSGLGVEQGLIDHLDLGGPSVLSRYTLRVLPNNKIRFNLKDDENDWSSVDSDISLDVNVWYSIVGVFNYATQELHIYINGEIHDGTIIYNALTGPAITPPNSLFLGNFAGAYNLNGTIDNVSIYNRALSPSDIQQLYTLGQTTYSWSNGATTPTFSVSPTSTTTYTCTITTNGVSCTDEVTVVVSQPVASITPNGLVEICEGQSIALTANGGTSYVWNTGAPTQSITVTTEGLYTVTATDANGCTDTESQFVKVNFLPDIAVNNASICSGQSAALTATGGLSYVWSPATGLSATTGSTVTSSTTTNTVYTVTGTSINGCTNTATAAVAVNALPTATITPATTTTFCQGGSVVLNANIGAELSYQWFNNAVAISGASTSTYTANASGSYTVVVTNTSTCSTTSNSIDVTTNANVDYFADSDGDGFGDVATLVSTCVQPQGYVTDNTDCNDNDSNVNTAATEVCNEIDDDCNGLIDDGLVFETYYADNDGDTYGDANNSIYECSQPSGYVTNNTDCNDNSSNQNAASAEICNGEDDDCDGAIDNGITFLDYYADADGDGFGAGDVISSCNDLGSGYTTNNTDCDDTNSNTNPSATETCNTIDDNCDGQTDDGTLTVYFIDNDNDTYGNPSVSILACTQPLGYTPDDTDCNDTDANINPGAEDIGGNGIDENCDGQIDNSILELNSTIALFPNPTHSELNIQINSSIIGNDLYIFDAVGKLVFKQKLLSTQTSIPVSNFADGNYVVRVGAVVKRFVVEK